MPPTFNERQIFVDSMNDDRSGTCMEGVVHGVGVGLPTQRGTDSCSNLTPHEIS